MADTSLASDRAKAAIYASAGVQEYWIVNLAERQLERFRSPNNVQYADAQILSSTDFVETTIGDKALRLDVQELFPTM